MLLPQQEEGITDFNPHYRPGYEEETRLYSLLALPIERYEPLSNLLCASIALSVKWGNKNIYLIGLL